MGKLFTYTLFAACFYYLYTSGVGMAILNGNIPVAGVKCEVQGPKNGQVYFASNKAELRWPIDAGIGFSSRDRHAAQTILAGKINSGVIRFLSDHTQVQVQGSSKINVYSCPYRVVKVSILSGYLKGRQGWMLRDDVIDTPMQKLVQENFRNGASHVNSEINSCNTNEPASNKYDF